MLIRLITKNAQPTKLASGSFWHRVQVLAWSSIAQSVCQRVFSLLAIWCLGSRFKSCFQQRNATCVVSIWISLACARASILTTTNMYIARARCESQLTVGSSGVKWAECSLIIGTGCRVQVLAWSSIAQSVCQRAFSLLAIWCLGSRVQILLSAEEHNLSPFDLNIACLCQNIEINNNKYVYQLLSLGSLLVEFRAVIIATGVNSVKTCGL